MPPEHQRVLDETLFEQKLLGLPTQRVGYSDRTAWLMSVMSQLAYFQFENESDIAQIVDDLAELSGQQEKVSFLASLIGGLDKGSKADRKAELERILKVGGFELIEVFDVAETQAFLARRETDDEKAKMMILAFRGTEKNIKDWKSDLKAKLVPPADPARKGRIHEGFQDAYRNVEVLIEEKIREHSAEPLYITGHSLGGALAVVATRFLDAGTLAACYTFGGPRVGDLELARVFKTPIYRLVNASDAVPRVPFGYGWYIPLYGLKLIRTILPRWDVIDKMHQAMEWVAGYTHYGDSRYLTSVQAGPRDGYIGLQLISNPGAFLGAYLYFNRLKATKGRGLIHDHSIGIYRAKLKAYALLRNLN